MTNLSEKITQKLYEIIYYGDCDEDHVSMNELILAEKFCNIILSNFDFKKSCANPGFLKEVSIESSVECSKEFLDTIDHKYACKLLENIEKGVLQFHDINEVVIGYISSKNGVKKIGIPIRYDYSDSFIITHEQIHDTILKLDEQTVTWSYFTEVPAMLVELLQADFMEKRKYNKEEIQKYKEFSHTGYTERALALKVQINFIKQILTEGYIDKKYLVDLFNDIYEICENEDLAENTINVAICKLFGHIAEDFYFFDLRYVIGNLLASYLHNLILEDEKKLKLFSEYNEKFSQLDICEVFGMLGLHMKEETLLDLDDDSYKVLEKSYQKELRRVW